MTHLLGGGFKLGGLLGGGGVSSVSISGYDSVGCNCMVLLLFSDRISAKIYVHCKLQKFHW